MSFYQACYTRIGNQERNAGWNVVAVTEGLSKEAVENFRAFASNAIRSHNRYSESPSKIFFIRTDERFVYICNLMPDCDSKDGRGNSFVHGYIIAKNEYYNRCRIPSSILGVEEFEFIRGIAELEQNCMQALPKRDFIRYREWDRQRLLQKYGLEGFSYNELLACVLSVLEREGASLCICIRVEQLDQLWECSKEVLYCIMDGLPHMFCTQISASSFYVGKGKLFFSEQMPQKKQEFFDLETGRWSCNLASVRQYSFIRMLIGNEETELQWKQTEMFFDEVYGRNGCSRINARLIESVYCYFNAREPQHAMETLSAFFDAGPAVCQPLYYFLIYLLRWVEFNCLDEAVREKLCYLYEIHKDEEYDGVYEKITVSQMPEVPELETEPKLQEDKKTGRRNLFREKIGKLYDGYRRLIRRRKKKPDSQGGNHKDG